MKTNPTMQAEAVLPTRPVSENGKINILTRLAYGGGDVACNVVYGMIATLLTLFYTDYAAVSVATVGLVMLISRFFDGGSDVVMGFIVDRTHSKWGQSRPWILWMSLPYALSAILLFSVPHTNATIQFLYIFVTYNFCTTVCYTAINLPYGSLSAMMTRDSKERDLLSVFRMGLSPMGRIIAVTCTMPLIKLFGDNQAAWVKVMSIWAAIAHHLLYQVRGNRTHRSPLGGKDSGRPQPQGAGHQSVFLGCPAALDVPEHQSGCCRHDSAVLLQVCVP